MEINFRLFKLRKRKKFLTRSCLIKIVNTKKISGLFKRKINLRITFLKKRSFLFKMFNKNSKKKFKFFFKRRKKNFYKVHNIDFSRHRKLLYFENRKFLRVFLKKKNLERQNKFNRYVINMINKDSKSLIKMFEYKLINVLIRCHFFNNSKDSAFFIKSGFILVNNSVVYDCNCILNLSDIIKFNNNQRYYSFYRNNLHNSIFILKKLNWAFYKFNKKDRFKTFFPKVYKWIEHNKLFGFDVPYSFEVDYVNMTIFILFKPLNLNFIEYSTIKYINLYLIRLYNWNYIN